MASLLAATLVIAILRLVHGANTCPDGISCESVYACEPLLEVVNKGRKTDADLKLLKDLRCGKNKYCCVSNTEISQRQGRGIGAPEPTPRKCQLSGQLPEPECCGKQSIINKIVGGSKVKLTDFPWLARIQNRRNNEYLIECGGVLISGRHVLTAGHCVKKTMNYDPGTPVNVHLGEYDTSNRVEDKDYLDGQHNDGVTVIAVEKITPHPEYRPLQDEVNNRRDHDIAMLRLSTTAPYTEFIRPICLPTKDITAVSSRSLKFYVAGWGKTESGKSSTIKQSVKVPYVFKKKCQKAYSRTDPPYTLKDHQICAGGESGKDSCGGDSGGPLMYSTGKTYEFVGMVSFGLKDCGSRGVPAVYTNVFKHVTWIKAQIEP